MIKLFSERDRLNSISRAILPKPLVNHFIHQDHSTNPTNCKNKEELIHKFKKYLHKHDYKIKSHTKRKWHIYDYNESDFSCYKPGYNITFKGPIDIIFINKGRGCIYNTSALGLMKSFYKRKVSVELFGRMFYFGIDRLFCFDNIYHLPIAFKNATLLGSKAIKWANEISDYPFS